MLLPYELDAIWDTLRDLQHNYGVQFSFTFDEPTHECRLDCRKNNLLCHQLFTYERLRDSGFGFVWSVRRLAESMAKSVYDNDRRLCYLRKE